MIYAQFYYDNGMEACGDRSVLILDGRYREIIQRLDAVEHGKKYGYRFASIHKGDSFTRSHMIVPKWEIPK